ncbi:MAG: hypothetical protein RR576_10515 [Oscillospiraceae bacterium]
MEKKLEGNKKIKKLLSHMMHSEAFGWPPSCLGPIYQPVRPYQMQEDTETYSIQLAHNSERK